MQVSQIRDKFLQFFANNGHTIVKSCSLVPQNDPTLLFTNAGMNQFKEVFLGLDKRDYVRATSAQKCVRAGGKHNDLENVGYTARHHTFFEMLGNFSFGDYFKQDAIKYAWEFLTSPQWLNIPKDKLYVTVYHTDDEAFDIWYQQIGLSIDRIIKIGDKADGGSDNFWQMGDTGPCGPCTEIFYDHGAKVPGGLPGSANEDGDRYIEVWNCVFMQFNRNEDGTLHPLPKPSVDTGMGLERISAVIQHVHSNYEIDLFVRLIDRASNITNCQDKQNPSLKVIADHIRSVSFLIADGVVPANEGRGYVLRRIIRRAIRHGYKLGLRVPFFYKLVDELVVQMGEAYPELILNQDKIKNVIKTEEERFFQTIENGMSLLQAELTKLKSNKLAGDVAFKLYDTYGFPLDLTSDVCRESNITVDLSGFDIAMNQQKTTAKAAGKFKMGEILEYSGCDTGFLGYSEQSVTAKVVALYKDGESTNQLNAGDNGVIVLDATVFYAEGGGQVGDTGIIQIEGGITGLFTVTDTQKIRSEVFGHIGSVETGNIKINDEITATFDLHKRLATARNHSVTHLLHKALHQVLGGHAVQKGSLVNSQYTRFDFAHDKPLTDAEGAEIERMVNHVIMLNYEVKTSNMQYDDAIKAGALALFGEKYANDVRVVQMGEFSTELCGGTHVKRTGDIGFFTITSEVGIANGIRRIEAITGETAVTCMQKNMAILDQLRAELKAQTNDIVPEKALSLIAENKKLYKEMEAHKTKLAGFEADKVLDKVAVLSNGVKYLVLELKDTENKELVELAEKLKDKLGSGIIIIGCNNHDRINLVVGVTKDLTDKYKAGVIVNHLAAQVGGKGGGRPDLAQAGGTDVTKLKLVLSDVSVFLHKLSSI
jgi:alanyl-tRNA synthetase